ncbi:unnamed protein product [Rhizoctonia solani]|uniref:Zn(2)-C6 fungal-type domain-containing protein n=1 Tax=Rhizoctonia solani TaxID=456999 RepID=A0A8H2WYI6_9AGAM|nr:unnamed protein product [Rhizoctonia solani]
MSRLIVVPKRSTRGCLTCKRRKKKCDEQRPYCQRCVQGDFHCLGYGSSEDDFTTSKTEVGFFHQSLDGSIIRDLIGSSNSAPLDGPSSLEGANAMKQPCSIRTPDQKPRTYPSTIPRGPSIDPFLFEDATSLVMSQFVQLSRELLFRPPLVHFETGLLWRLEHSEFTRWSMYLSARVLQDMSNGINGQKYMGWIFRFCQRILESPTSTEPATAMEGRLGGLHDLTYLGFIISGVSLGYSLFQRSTPAFLRLAALDSGLWSDNSTILFSKAIRSVYEISRFVAHDTIIALILGVPPLLHYDTTSPWDNDQPGRVIELIYGIPTEILYILAKINGWRASRLMGEATHSQTVWRDIEESLNKGSPAIHHTDDPVTDIARFAVQETWRQVAIIYFYMGMRGVNSADPRVEAAVQQVVQLGSTITLGSALEMHTLIPCVIAGAAARQEKHRASLRTKVARRSSQREITLVLRVSEFAPVLDHLWHGAGADGKPTTWDDYAQSRAVVLPIAC